MQDDYVYAFKGVVRETQKQTGFELPEHLEAYIVMLLASYVDKPHFEPTDSFAESYLNLSSLRCAKQLGDTCLFVSGVFPTYGTKKGLNREYYKNLGKSSYSSMHGQLFVELSMHFDVLSNFIELSSTPPKDTHCNLFR